ncbi:MAG: HlyD family efflux transporter periplasmic adaptor subunit, partial [Bacteroidota bacterium]|nr:HlyD family efflux transporter periplasmic adaptor subunit [Bacteroidota bacterium]MDX5430821.1 HlyD family efflux transporter periplasmic adaptor subunit [Bacteroidota bacterium]
KGDLILKLSNQDLELDFMNRETALLDQLNNLRNTQISLVNTGFAYQQQLADLEAQLHQAKFQWKANEKLYRDSLISYQEKETSRSNYQSLEKRVGLLEKTIQQHESFTKIQSEQLHFSSSLIRKSLETLRKSLDMLELQAPASGLLTGLNLELGESVIKGQKVAEIDLQKGYLLEALVDEVYINRLQTGLKARVDLDGKSHDLRIEKIYPQVKDGQFRVDLTFVGPTPNTLKYGQSIQIKLSLGDAAPSLLLKRGGFFQKTGGNWVYVLEGNKALKRSTSFGRQNPDFLEILSGLHEGDQVIISSYSLFGDADEIVIEDE